MSADIVDSMLGRLDASPSDWEALKAEQAALRHRASVVDWLLALVGEHRRRTMPAVQGTTEAVAAAPPPVVVQARPVTNGRPAKTPRAASQPSAPGPSPRERAAALMLAGGPQEPLAVAEALGVPVAKVGQYMCGGKGDRRFVRLGDGRWNLTEVGRAKYAPGAGAREGNGPAPSSPRT